MAQVVLENDAMRVGVRPAFGARVTSFIDKVTKRDWIAPRGESAATGEDAIYLADEAVGWDECFPTVGPWDARAAAWGRRLRDHGDLWGWPQAGEIHQLAIEPTTAPVDHLGQAIERGTALTLAPGAGKSSSMTLKLRHDALRTPGSK